MKTITSVSIGSGRVTHWRLPTQAELADNIAATAGRSYDRVERKEMSGHVPMLIEKVG